MYYRLLIVIAIAVFSCKKELDINDFSDDFGYYQPELRIEALMLPKDNTAIIRIDRSTRLDEGLNDEGYYNCIDDDDDWNYYYCDIIHTSYENRCACEKVCSENNIENCDDLDANSFRCNRHLYKCDNESDSLVTFVDKNNCICENGKCITDDVGIDGEPAFGDLSPDEGEGDGQPGCGEPKVDEFDEVLPGIHINKCNVSIIHRSDTCQFIYNENAGEFFDGQNFGANILDAEIVNYGAWIPDSNFCSTDFNHYDEEYGFEADCRNEIGFESTGKIIATDILKRPVVFFKESYGDSIEACSQYDNNDAIYNCMNTFSIDSIKFIKLSEPNISEDSLMTLANIFGVDTLQIVSHLINYASLFETSKYQAIQYVMDKEDGKWFYWHGHPAAVTNDEFIINNKICLFWEVVTGYEFEGTKYSKYKYDIFTFSKGYENYYFYDQLDLSDPVRTNLRDASGNTVMGGFGAMAGNTIFFEVISSDSLLGR